LLTVCDFFVYSCRWFGFNSGSTGALTNGQYGVAATAAVNTLIATGAGGLTITLHFAYSRHVHDSWALLNGMLAGLVAITPACATVEPYMAIVIGITSVYAYIIAEYLISKARVDDVVDAAAVHLGCGLWGTLATAVLSNQRRIDAAYGPGVIHYDPAVQLGYHLLASACVVIFCGGCAAILFLIYKYTVGIRVSEGDERVGLDFKYHAGYAYPDFNNRVKKAHEQMALEAEIANQVRKELVKGRGDRFKHALGTSPLPGANPSSPAYMIRPSGTSSANSKGGELTATTHNTTVNTHNQNKFSETPVIAIPSPPLINKKITLLNKTLPLEKPLNNHVSSYNYTTSDLPTLLPHSLATSPIAATSNNTNNAIYIPGAIDSQETEELNPNPINTSSPTSSHSNSN
jgi:hypothetical protein